MSEHGTHSLVVFLSSMPEYAGAKAVTYLSQSPVLLDGPHCHDVRSCGEEEIACCCLGSNIEPQPLHNLSEIVCTSDVVEEKSIWNLVSLDTFGSEIPQSQVGVEVRSLSHKGYSEAQVHLGVRDGSVQRMI